MNLHLIKHLLFIMAFLFCGQIFAITPIEVAQNLFKRLTGARLKTSDQRLTTMSQKISSGDYLGAAEIASNDDGFYNYTLKIWGAKMSNLSESPIFKNPTVLGGYGSGTFGSLDDFTATIIGATRDNWDARNLLTSDFYYKANMTVDRSAALPAPWLTMDSARTTIHSEVTLSSTNEHYIFLEKNDINLRNVLEAKTQRIRTDKNEPAGASAPPQMINNPDAAGLLTTRAFLVAHLTDGTNRRLIEYAFREFACKPISEWADTGSVALETSDLIIRRDIDRAPGEDPQKFKDTCIRCHGGLDGLAGASAHFDLNMGINSFRQRDFPVYKDTYSEQFKNEFGVMKKHNKNAETFPNGRIVKDNSWVNYATKNHNKDFGWTGPLAGKGLKEFGKMLANSRAFTQCMAKRVFTAMCKREPQEIETETINSLANSFVNDKYNLRVLFMRAATLPTCLPH